MGTLNEFIYFNKEYKGKGDFSGDESAFDSKGRVDFLNSYLAFLQRQYALERGSKKAVKQGQVEQVIKAEHTLILPTTRKTLYIDEMTASAKACFSAYEGWQFYTERAGEKDGCVVFNDNYIQPVPCAKYVFRNGETLEKLFLNIYIAGDYGIKRTHNSLERAPLDIETGRIIELRGGLAEILKIQFYADGRTFALVGNKDIYHHTKIYIGRFEFDAWNEVEILLKDGFYNVRLNDGMTSNLAFTERGVPDTLFLSGGRHPVGEWKVLPEKFVFGGKEQTVFFQKRAEEETAGTALGEVRLPYKLGGYENRDKYLILRKEFTAEKAARALLTVDTMDPGGEIFVNGKSVCKADGFMRQRIDIQNELVEGKNLLEIVVFPRAPEILYPWHRCKDVYNAWMCGKVKIDFCAEVHIDALEVFTLQTLPEVQAKMKVRLNRKHLGKIRVFLRETYPEYGEETEIYQGEVKGKEITAKANINANVWSPENPCLYAVRVQIEDENGKAIDDYTEETGFRTIKQKDGAIFLNGKKVCLKGALIMQFLAPYNNICKSHVCPTDEEIVWQLCALKNMNANTARLHMLGYGTNDSRIAKYADRLGILLIWTTRWIDSVECVQWGGEWKCAKEYAKQMQEVINHPSIIMWEGSNELHARQECTDRLYDEFVSAVKSVDKTRLLSPCSHLYYGGGLYGNEGFYYQDNGKRNQDFKPTACSFGWKDPLVIRSAHTYEIMLGYGGDWKSFREQAWRTQPSLFKSKKHAYLVSEIAVMGRHDDSTEECRAYVKSDSYELQDELLALGVELEQRDWKISQAYQALAAQHIAKSLLANDADGILWCCLSGGANDGSYFKPPIDFYGYAKYAFYVLKESFAEEIAFNNDTAVAVGEDFTVKPVLSQVAQGATYDLAIRIKNADGNVVASTEYHGVTAEKELMNLPPWKPTLEQNGYYQIEYILDRTSGRGGMKMNTVLFEDEIVLYWDKQWELPDGVRYRVTLNGKEIATTQKTHFEIVDLQAQTQYAVIVERLDENGNAVETLFSDCLQTPKKRTRIDVTKAPYNAVGDGKTLNTQALQRAFDDCKAGETVYISRGKYLTGALDMRGDTELYLEKGAVLQGTAKVADYAPKRWSRFEGIEMECYAALLNIGTIDNAAGYTTKNVIIRGGGTVSGGGKELCQAVIESERERLKAFLNNNEEYVKTCENSNTIPGRARPRLVSVNNTVNVIFGNVTFQYGPAWNLHFVYSKNVVTYNCTIRSEGVWNGDGWDPDSSENCTIFGCTFATHDDAVAIKSGKNPEGNVINRPTKNVRIFDCHGKNGISLGSEMSGGIENVFVWDCNIFHSFTGLRIKTTRKRGGYVKNVRVRNCALADIRIWTKYYSNDDGESSGELTILEDFCLENIEIAGICIEQGKVYSVPALTVAGFDEEARHIKNVTLSNIKIHKKKGDTVEKVQIENVKNLTIANVTSIIDEA